MFIPPKSWAAVGKGIKHCCQWSPWHNYPHLAGEKTGILLDGVHQLKNETDPSFIIKLHWVLKHTCFWLGSMFNDHLAIWTMTHGSTSLLSNIKPCKGGHLWDHCPIYSYDLWLPYIEQSQWRTMMPWSQRLHERCSTLRNDIVPQCHWWKSASDTTPNDDLCRIMMHHNFVHIQCIYPLVI